jgi:hypothetical protein
MSKAHLYLKTSELLIQSLHLANMNICINLLLILQIRQLFICGLDLFLQLINLRQSCLPAFSFKLICQQQSTHQNMSNISKSAAAPRAGGPCLSCNQIVFACLKCALCF